MSFWDKIDGVTLRGPSKKDSYTRKAVLEHLHVNLTLFSIWHCTEITHLQGSTKFAHL